MFLKFCARAQIPLNFPFTGYNIAAFIAYMNEQNYKPSSIRSYLTAISAVHKVHSVKDPTSTYLVSRTLIGARKLQKEKSLKLYPINKELVHKLVNTVEKILPYYETILFQAIFLLSYYCCLRASEVVFHKYSHTLQLKDLKLQEPPLPPLVEVTFASFKHSDTPTSLILHPQNNKFCPVKALLKYVSHRGDRDGPLFISQNSMRPVSRHFFSKTLKDCLSSLGVNNQRYNTHSFRIGRATDLAIHGAPSHVIKNAGRWRSNAYEKYIRLGQISFPAD